MYTTTQDRGKIVHCARCDSRFPIKFHHVDNGVYRVSECGFFLGPGTVPALGMSDHIRIYTIRIIKRKSHNKNESIKHDDDDNEGKSNDEIDIYYDDYKIKSAPPTTIPKTTETVVSIITSTMMTTITIATQNQRRS